MYYIGLDIHKKTISYCIKQGGGEVHAQGVVNATRAAPGRAWIEGIAATCWSAAAMEATLFTGWIYDHLLPHAAAVKVAHPLMLPRAIAASKEEERPRRCKPKSPDLLRCDLLPECYMAPVEMRERRRTLRYRNLLVRQSVQMKNKLAGLLMETGVTYNGVTYNKEKLHQKKYFTQLVKVNPPELPEALKPLLKVGRGMTVERATASEKALLRALRARPRVGGPGGAARDDSGHRLDHGTELGTGDRRGDPLCFREARGAVTAALCSAEEPVRPAFRNADPFPNSPQQTSSNGSD